MALYKILFLLLILSFLSACGNPQENEARKSMQDFETWMKQQSEKQKTWPEEEWQQAKQHYLKFEAEMEARLPTLSEELRQKYAALKTRFEAWEEDVKADREALSAATQAEWQNKLLGQFSDTSAITASNIRNAYTHFMENVRKNYKEWTQPDWNRAENVHILLDSRKDQLADRIPLADEVAIGALQAEYETLQAGDEVQDVVN